MRLDQELRVPLPPSAQHPRRGSSLGEADPADALELLQERNPKAHAEHSR